MSPIELILTLLAVVALAAALATSSGVPAPVLLVFAGLLVGFAPGLPSLELDPDVVFVVFLPPLVHAAGYWASPHRLRRDASPVAWLGVALVIVSGLAVTVVGRTILGLTWARAAVLGTIVAPTDTVAALSIFRRLGVSDRLLGLVEGENLISDATALVAYKLAVAAVLGAGFSAGSAALKLVLVSLGGIAIGLAVGWLLGEIRRRVQEPHVEITLTLVVPYLSFIPAEHLGVSGILAAISSGLYSGWRAHELFGASNRLQAYAFWQQLTFLLESLLFILVGMQFPTVLKALSSYAPATLVLFAVAVAGVLIVTRLGFVLALGSVRRGRLPGARQHIAALSTGERTVLGWAGMRGGISLAAALALPLQTDAGAALPARDLILFVTFGVIGATLLLQGLTLPTLVRRVDARADPKQDELQAVRIRLQVAQAVLNRLGDFLVSGDVSPELLERARVLYTQRVERLASACQSRDQDPYGTPDVTPADWSRLRRGLLSIERKELLSLRGSGAIPPATLLAIEHDLDLDEARLAAPQTTPVA